MEQESEASGATILIILLKSIKWSQLENFDCMLSRTSYICEWREYLRTHGVKYIRIFQAFRESLIWSRDLLFGFVVSPFLAAIINRT